MAGSFKGENEQTLATNREGREGSRTVQSVVLTAQLSNPMPKLPPAVSRAQPAEPPTSRPRRLTERKVDELVRLRSEGLLVRELAERFGIHRETAGLHLKRRNA